MTFAHSSLEQVFTPNSIIYINNKQHYSYILIQNIDIDIEFKITDHGLCLFVIIENMTCYPYRSRKLMKLLVLVFTWKEYAIIQHIYLIHSRRLLSRFSWEKKRFPKKYNWIIFFILKRSLYLWRWINGKNVWFENPINSNRCKILFKMI